MQRALTAVWIDLDVMAEILDKGQITVPTLSTANESSDDDLLQVDPAEFIEYGSCSARGMVVYVVCTSHCLTATTKHRLKER